MQFYNDEKGREDEKLVETKSILLIRPSLEDDSQKVSFTERHPGDWVEVLSAGCWWRGVVARRFKDHFTVLFPSSEEDPYHIWQPPKSPERYRARTAKEYNHKTKQWERIPPTWYEGCERSISPSSPPTSSMLPQSSRDKQALSPKARSKIRLAHRSTTQHVKPVQPPTRSASPYKSSDAALATLIDPSLLVINKESETSTLAFLKQSLSTSIATKTKHVQLLKVDSLKDGHLHSAAGCLDTHAGSQVVVQTFEIDTRQPQDASAKNIEVVSQHLNASNIASRLSMQQAEGTDYIQTAMTQGVNDQQHSASQAHGSCVAKIGSKLVKATARQSSHADVFVGGKAKILDEQLVAPPQADANGKTAISLIDKTATQQDDKEAPASIIGRDKELSLVAQPFNGPSKSKEEIRCSQKQQTSENGESVAHGRPGKDETLYRSDSPTAAAHQNNGGKKLKPGLPKAAAYLRNGLATKGVPPTVALALGKKRSASQELEREGLLTQRLRRSNSSLSRHCVLCVDFLGSGLSSSEFTLKLNELLPNSLGACIAEVQLQSETCKGGWGFVCFATEDETMLALERLKCLYMRRPGVPFPTPILVHRPRLTKYPWGKEATPPGHVTTVSAGHFMQPNSLDFKPAQEWRTLELQLGDAKEQLLDQQRRELEEVMEAYFEQASITKPEGIPPPPLPLTSSQLWLKGLAPNGAAAEDIATAFCQWIGVGDQSMESNKLAVTLLQDPVFGNYTGQALVQMNSEDQATWVQADMSDMIFTLGHGPCPVQAAVAKPGGPHGAMGTLERALQSIFDGKVVIGQMGEMEFVCIPEPQNVEEVVAYALRELMMSHVDQRQALKRQAKAWRQYLHKEHHQIFKEEFGKYTRAAQLCQSAIMQHHIKQRRPGSTRPNRSKIPNLFGLLVKLEEEVV